MQVLTHQDIGRIHDATLDVLESRGVVFHTSARAVDILKKNGCLVDGFQVRFPKKLVEECLTQLPDRDTLRPNLVFLSFADEVSLKKGESHVGLIGNAYYIYDYEKGCQRDCVEADVDDKLLLLDSLQHFECDCCHLVFHSERHGDKVFADYDAVEASMEFIRRRVKDRARVAILTSKDLHKLPLRWPNRSDEERRLEVLSNMILQGPQVTQERLEKLNDFFVWCNPISPLQYFPEETNGILRVAESGDPTRLIMISPMVMMGATGPVTLAGTLVQNNAEVLAGTVLAQLVGPGTPVIYGCVSTVMDLRTAENSLGHFETGMLNVAAVQMADHYGMPSRIAPGNTSVRKPGARAAVETAMGLYMGLAAGGNLITTGLLDSLLMISYEHLVLVDELIGHIKSIVGGIRTDEASLAVEEIQQHGHPSPGFLASDHTVRFMKRDVYYSDFTGRTEKSYQEWYDKAHDKVKEILGHGPSRKPANDYMDEVILERLAAVGARLTEDNKTWRTGQDDWWQFYVQDFH